MRVISIIISQYYIKDGGYMQWLKIGGIMAVFGTITEVERLHFMGIRIDGKEAGNQLVERYALPV